MSDPFSAASSVAGLISLGAATSKLVYQFVSSIVDAPKDARAVISLLYGVNTALCQVQTLLLDLTYASQTGADSFTDLERSVTCCVASFSLVEKEIKSLHQTGSEDLTVKRVWHQVKYVFEKESMRDALARLEGGKATLKLILTALNSKIMADVLRNVKDTGKVVRKTHQKIQRVELKLTRILEDALGRSYSSTSSVSLDSMYTQAEIERMLSDSGSSLSLTLTDMAEDSASVVVIPDTLSGVDGSTATIMLPLGTIETDSDTASVLSNGTDTLDMPTTTSNATANSSARVTVDSYFSLSDTLDTSRNNPAETMIHASTAQQIASRVYSDRLPKVSKPNKRWLAIMKPSGISTDPLSALAVAGNIIQMIQKANDLLKMVHDSSSVSSFQLQQLERARARVESFQFFMETFSVARESNASDYIRACQARAERTLTEYLTVVKKTYEGSTKRALFAQALQLSKEKINELWADFETSMDELDRAINLTLMLEIRKETYNAQPERQEMHKDLLGRLSKIEANQLQLEASLQKVSGTESQGDESREVAIRGKGKSVEDRCDEEDVSHGETSNPGRVNDDSSIDIAS